MDDLRQQLKDRKKENYDLEDRIHDLKLKLREVQDNAERDL